MKSGILLIQFFSTFRDQTELAMESRDTEEFIAQGLNYITK
jgi:hypothetical protein